MLTLAHLGYLETDGSYFWLSAKVLRFSGSYLSTARLPRTVQPTLNRLAAQALGVRPRDCVVLEDAALGVEAAKAAGMFCIGYRNPSSGNQDLSRADLVIDNIEDIPVETL